MSGISGFFDRMKENRQNKKIARSSRILARKNSTEEQRKTALDELREMKSAEAISALLTRFDHTIEKTIADLEEKEMVHDLLISYGDISIPLVKSYMIEKPKIAWPLKILSKLLTRDELLEFILGLLSTEESIFDESTHQKKLEILLVLKEFVDPRVLPKTLSLLHDEDDEVKLLALAVIESQEDDEEVRTSVIEMFHRENDNNRIQRRIIDLFIKKEWPVTGFRKDVEKMLQPGLMIDKNNIIRKRGY